MSDRLRVRPDPSDPRLTRRVTGLDQDGQRIETSVTAEDTTIESAPAVEVTVSAPVPLLGLWGAGTMTVSARAFEEAARG